MIGSTIDKLIANSSHKKDGNRKAEYRSYSIIEPNSTKLCLLLPPWHISKVVWNILQNRLHKQGYSLVVVEAGEDILSDDPTQIIENFRKVRSLALEEIEKVKAQQNISELDVVGLSLGTVSALYAATGGMEINKLILVCPADDLADGIWYGIRTEDIHSSLISKEISLKSFQNGLQEMSMRKQDKLYVHEVCIYLSEQDSIIPYKLGIKLKTIFENYKIPVTLNVNRSFGHYLTFIDFCLRPKI